MAGFKVPCPSCEHQVPVKGEEAVGTKTECPKCKYRFKVEAPAGGAAKDEGGKGAKAEKKAAAGGKKRSKKLVAVVAGVLAVAVLGYAASSFIGGDGGTSKNKVVPKGQPPKLNPQPSPDGTKPEDPDKKPDDPNNKTKGPSTPVGPPASTQEASNLLPPEAVAVCRLDLEKVRQPPALILFDRTTRDMFRASFGLDPDAVGLYYHASVGDKRDPFGVIRLRTPVAEKDVVARMAPHAAPRAVGKKGWNLYAFTSNPFATAAGNALQFSSLFADLFEPAPAAGPEKPAAPRAVGLCVYDTQHVLVGDLGQLEAFLGALDDKGLPKFRSSPNPTGDQAQAKEPLYLSLDPKLKAALRELGAESAAPPAVVYAERYAPGRFDLKRVVPEYRPAAAVLDPVLARARAVGVSLNGFSTANLSATVRVVMDSTDAAFEVVRDQLVPGLALAAPAAALYLNTPVEFRNLTGVGSVPPPTDPGAQPVDPDDPRRPVGKFPQPPRLPPEGMPPEGMPPGTDPPKDPETRPLPPSYLELTRSDEVVTLAVELNWNGQTYRTRVEPLVLRAADALRGKFAVFASDRPFHALAPAVKRRVEAAKAFPRGTADRPPGDLSRKGLRYPPQTRVSFFADLLPDLGRDDVVKKVDRRRAWSDPDNLPAGEAWVPELLVASYPEAAWRAASPAVPAGRLVGGTNYVAVAGVGLDAARLDPAAPENAKKVGITGYDWGSRVEEVADGLENTIYLLQTPPGLSQPWIAGGGATVRGLDPVNPMRGFAHTFGTPDGKPGTFALMADGTVRFLPADIKPDLLLAMATRAGGENIADRLDTEAPRVDPPKKAEPKVEPKPEPAAEVAPAPRAKS